MSQSSTVDRGLAQGAHRSACLKVLTTDGIGRSIAASANNRRRGASGLPPRLMRQMLARQNRRVGPLPLASHTYTANAVSADRLDTRRPALRFNTSVTLTVVLASAWRSKTR